jgi:hypothetical protein
MANMACQQIVAFFKNEPMALLTRHAHVTNVLEPEDGILILDTDQRQNDY